MAAPDESDLLTPEDRAFARSLRSERESRGWSQGDLAQRMAARGLRHVSQVTISRIEHGKRAARLGEAEVIAELLERPLAALTLLDERAQLANVLMSTVDEAERALSDLRDRAARAGALWSQLEADRGVMVNAMRSPAYEGVPLPEEGEQAVTNYVQRANSMLRYDVFGVLEHAFTAERERGPRRGQAADSPE